ncbi:MAG: hypothetical protein WDN48_10480 [Pseudolabrys sp.]
MRKLIVLPLLLVCAWSDAKTPTLAAEAWEIQYSTGVKLNAPAPGQEFSFNFPRTPGSVRYVTRPATRPAGGAIHAAFTIAANGAAFDFRTAPDNTCTAPAAVRLFLQRNGDDMSGAGPYEHYRWWSIASTVLKNGSFAMDVALKPSAWTSVFGKSGDASPAAFAAAIADVGAVGVTFGGGCFAGHGVGIRDGGAAFTMTRFAVE